MEHAATTATPAPDAAAPGGDLLLTGAVRLVLVINLGSFVEDADVDTFRHLRGSEHFAAALRRLHPAAPFGLSEAAAQAEQDGYALRIFRSRLLANHFFPTYRMAWDSTARERLAGLPNLPAWLRWTVQLRLTRNGLAVITLEQPFERQTMVGCSERLLELPSESAPEGQGQWSLGMVVLEMFLESIGRAIEVPVGGRGGPRVRFGALRAARHTVRLDRYVIYVLRRVERGGEAVDPAALKREEAPALAAFMEGALVDGGGARRLPRYAADQAAALVARDASSWDEELCLLGGECALLYCPLLTGGVVYVGGPVGLSAQAYARYWDGVVRGLEHVIAFRAEVQQTERRTTDLLGHVPSLTRRVNQGDLTPDEVEAIDHLATSLADIFDNLPEQRSMAVSANAFRADYARRKFELLMAELDVPETLALVNTNVEQLNFFLSYYSDMRLQWQGQRTNDSSVLIGEVVLFMALSSFAADTFNVGDRLGLSGFGDFALVGGAIALVLALAAARWVGRLGRLRRRVLW